MENGELLFLASDYLRTYTDIACIEAPTKRRVLLQIAR